MDESRIRMTEQMARQLPGWSETLGNHQFPDGGGPKDVCRYCRISKTSVIASLQLRVCDGTGQVTLGRRTTDGE